MSTPVAPALPIYKSTEVFVYEKSDMIDPRADDYVEMLEEMVNEIANRLNKAFDTNDYIEYFHRKHNDDSMFNGVATHYFKINDQIQVQISNEFYQYEDGLSKMTKWSVLFQYVYFNYDAYHIASPIVDCFTCEAERDIHDFHNHVLFEYHESMDEACEDYRNDV